MTQATQLERYLHNEPLTPELEALANGEEPETATEQPAAAAPAGLVIESITDDQREHLRRLTFEPGWPIVLGLMDRAAKHMEALAHRASMDDPLGKKEQVAEAWAYVAMMRRTKKRLLVDIGEELNKLGGQK